MDINFSELSVYTEAIINAISPSSSTFSTTILTVSSILDGFYSSLYPECSECLNMREQDSISSFQNPTHFQIQRQ